MNDQTVEDAILGGFKCRPHKWGPRVNMKDASVGQAIETIYSCMSRDQTGTAYPRFYARCQSCGVIACVCRQCLRTQYKDLGGCKEAGPLYRLFLKIERFLY